MVHLHFARVLSRRCLVAVISEGIAILQQTGGTSRDANLREWPNLGLHL